MIMPPHRLRQAYHPSPADRLIDEALAELRRVYRDNPEDLFREIEQKKQAAAGSAPELDSDQK